MKDRLLKFKDELLHVVVVIRRKNTLTYHTDAGKTHTQALAKIYKKIYVDYLGLDLGAINK